MRAQAAISATILALILAAAPLGCARRGYTFDSTYDKSIRTISIPIFDNETFHPGLETLLTQAIAHEIQTNTPWRVTDSSGADTRLEGRITAVQLRTLSTRNRTGLVEEQGLTVTVDFQWRDNRSGDVLVGRDHFAAAATFVPATDTGERIEIGQRQAIAELARSIVAELRSNW